MKRRDPLTPERILKAARELAAAEGLDALTMRRLAAELDIEAMSLYHHFPNKDALLDGLVATVIGEVRDAVGERAGTDWRAALRVRCLTAHDVMVRHPWAPRLIGTRTTVPPSVIFYYEEVLGLLLDGGFSYALAHKALYSLGSMSLGFVQELFSPDRGFDAEAAEAEFEELAAQLPNLTAMVAEIYTNDGDGSGSCDGREEFEFTLDLLLEGLERRLKD